MIEALVLAAALRAQLEQEAKAAFPRECCGLIEGVLALSQPAYVEASAGRQILPVRRSLGEGGSKGEIKALHPMSNIASEADSFEIDPAAHIALLRKLRGTGRAIIGCYHSHPNGRAEPSARDIARAAEVDFLWLIAALRNEDADPETGAFVWTGSCFAPVIVKRV
jgi:proteasome lid subunit RPN8/RPN11